MQKEHPRIVSLVPSWTETLFHFGFDAEIVGVTRWCVHPKELTARVEKVGGTKDPDIARVVALRPDLVVCEKEENRKEDVAALREAGIQVWMSDVRDIDSSLAAVLALGQATGKPEAAQALVERIGASVAEVREATAVRAPVPLYVPIWRSPWMTLTKDTYADALLSIAGAANVFREDAGRYPERGPEEAIEAGAQAVLLPTEPYPFHTKPQAVDELVEAGFPRERILGVDGEALTWYGARAVEGVRSVAKTVRSVPR